MLILPRNYNTPLDNYDMQHSIDKIRTSFQAELSKSLVLKRVSAPLFVMTNTGINDDLSGTERAVRFDIPDLNKEGEVVHSLAKWKRIALKKYGFHIHKGLWTDMNAIRRDEKLDNYHSIYVDQWDWEKIINDEDRTIDYLKETVNNIAEAIYNTNQMIQKRYSLNVNINKDVYFITSQELLDTYPDMSSQHGRRDRTL